MTLDLSALESDPEDQLHEHDHDDDTPLDAPDVTGDQDDPDEEV